MSRRVIPAGVSLKDFHGWAGNLDRIDVGYNIDPIRAWRTHPISRFAGRVTPENFTVLGGDLPAPTPHHHIKNLRIPEF